jgi:ubiquinone/menaquinone biosynthesis C-methylase UbiE
MLYRNRTLYWLASTIPFAGQWRVWQRLVLPRLRGRDVLELGCGIGTLLADMAESGYVCTGIDRSSQMVEAARRELRRRHVPESAATVQRADASALPFTGGSFDTVVSTFPTEYILDSRVIAEVVRVLRPGGRMVVVPGAALTPASPVLAPLLLIQRTVYGRQSDAPSRRAGPEPKSSLAALLETVGLRAREERVTGPFWVAHVITAEKV